MTELSLLDTLLGNGAADCFNSLYSTFTAPACDITESKDSYKIEMDLPGKMEKDVEINLNDDVLTVSSVKKDEKEEKKSNKDETKVIIRERCNSSFTRSFTLPNNADSSKIEAKFNNGVLTITVGKKETAAQRKIEIKAA